MLILTRRVNEDVFIRNDRYSGENITIKIKEINGGQIKLGIEAPAHIDIARAEARNKTPKARLQGNGEQSVEYGVVVERGSEGWTASVPDIPGCVVAAKGEEDVLQLIQDSIQRYLAERRANGESPPQPHTKMVYVTVPTA